ncbi:MAG: amidase family protein, partial [Nitrospiria bacterium]
MNWIDRTTHELHDALLKKEVSSKELVAAFFERIHAVEEQTKVYLTLLQDQALIQADEADRAIAGGNAGPLTGIPVALKDNLCTEGVQTSCASKILDGFVSPYDATVVSR